MLSNGLKVARKQRDLIGTDLGLQAGSIARDVGQDRRAQVPGDLVHNVAAGLQAHRFSPRMGS